MGLFQNIVYRFQRVPHYENFKEAMGVTFTLIKFGCFLHVTNSYLGGIILVRGPSMLPSLNLTGDVVLMERISPRFECLRVGDIVLVRSPENPRKLVTKRITAMEGDTVTFSKNLTQGGGLCTVIVPKGYAWVQGDNTHHSRDSRHFGAVPYGLLQGKVIWRVWPLNGFGSLSGGMQAVDP